MWLVDPTCSASGNFTHPYCGNVRNKCQTVKKQNCVGTPQTILRTCIYLQNISDCTRKFCKRATVAGNFSFEPYLLTPIRSSLLRKTSILQQLPRCLLYSTPCLTSASDKLLHVTQDHCGNISIPNNKSEIWRAQADAKTYLQWPRASAGFKHPFSGLVEPRH